MNLDGKKGISEHDIDISNLLNKVEIEVIHEQNARKAQEAADRIKNFGLFE